MKKPIKIAVWIIVILGIVGYSIYAMIQPLPVKIVEVQPTTIRQTFKEEGKVVPSVERPIYSQNIQEIIEVAVKEGQQVRKGDVLVQLDTKQLEFQVQQLKAQKASTEAQEKKTYKELEQQLKQLRSQLVSLVGQEKQSNRDPYSAQIKQQELAIEETKRQLSEAEIEYERIKSLYDNGAASKVELEQAERTVAQLNNSLLQQQEMLILIKEQAEPVEGTEEYFAGQKEAIQTQIELIQYQLQNGGKEPSGTKQYFQEMIESIQAQIDQVEYQIQRSTIIAPIDGVVGNLIAKEGLNSSPQTLLLTVFQSEQYKIEVFVLSEDILNVKEGMNVKLIQERKEGDRTLAGKVVSIAPSAEERVSALGLVEQRIKVEIVPEKQIELRPGYALDVEFTTHEEKDRLIVPKTTIFPYEEKDAVWVVRDGKAVIQPVVKGLETDQDLVIAEGLQAGDQVISNPELEGLEEEKTVSIQK